MSCDVAVLPFQAHANYGSWLIDFKGLTPSLLSHIKERTKKGKIEPKTNKFNSASY